MNIYDLWVISALRRGIAKSEREVETLIYLGIWHREAILGSPGAAEGRFDCPAGASRTGERREAQASTAGRLSLHAKRYGRQRLASFLGFS